MPWMCKNLYRNTESMFTTKEWFASLHFAAHYLPLLFWTHTVWPQYRANLFPNSTINGISSHCQTQVWIRTSTVGSGSCLISDPGLRQGTLSCLLYSESGDQGGALMSNRWLRCEDFSVSTVRLSSKSADSREEKKSTSVHSFTPSLPSFKVDA